MPGEFDRYNMKRVVSLTANIAGADLGRVASQVERAIARAGTPPKGALVEIRGQIAPMNEILRGLAMGLIIAVLVIILLLTANFQSVRLAFVVISTAPAVAAGVVVSLDLTGSTLNLQSFMGAIMAIGVAVANSILLVTFAERHRRQEGTLATRAAVAGALGRLRPILMTSCAMIAGMLPMALGLSEGSEQTAPLGRAVIGGLAAATLATLLVLPAFFAILQAGAARLGVDRSGRPHELALTIQPSGYLLRLLMFRKTVCRFPRWCRFTMGSKARPFPPKPNIACNAKTPIAAPQGRSSQGGVKHAAIPRSRTWHPGDAHRLRDDNRRL